MLTYADVFPSRAKGLLRANFKDRRSSGYRLVSARPSVFMVVLLANDLHHSARNATFDTTVLVWTRLGLCW